ncbi:MAG: hypothetical protein ACRDQF_01055 [Thermocrispum sp.]
MDATLGELPWLDRLGGGVPPGARYWRSAPAGAPQLPLQRSEPERVDAIDLDPAMIARAERRLARFGDRVPLAQGPVSTVGRIRPRRPG